MNSGIHSDKVFLRLLYQMYKELCKRKPSQYYKFWLAISKSSTVAQLYYLCSYIYWNAGCLRVVCVLPKEISTTSRRDSSSDLSSHLETVTNSHVSLRNDEFAYELTVSGQLPAAWVAQEKWLHVTVVFTGLAPDHSANTTNNSP